MNKITKKQATLEEKIAAVAEVQHIGTKEVAIKYDRSESCIKKWVAASKNTTLKNSKGSGRPKVNPKEEYKKNLYDEGFWGSLNEEQKDEVLKVLHTFFLQRKSR